MPVKMASTDEYHGMIPVFHVIVCREKLGILQVGQFFAISFEVERGFRYVSNDLDNELHRRERRQCRERYIGESMKILQSFENVADPCFLDHKKHPQQIYMAE